MAKHTARDHVWSQALQLAERRRHRTGFYERPSFRAAEIVSRLDEHAPSNRTVRDVLATMADLGHLDRASKQGEYQHPDIADTTEQRATPDDHLGETQLQVRVDHDRDDQDDQDDALAFLEAVETPSMTHDRQQFVEAASALYDALADQGPLTRSEFQAQLHDDHSAGYENERTWWRRVAKPALKAHPDVVVPAGGNPWKIVAE